MDTGLDPFLGTLARRVGPDLLAADRLAAASAPADPATDLARRLVLADWAIDVALPRRFGQVGVLTSTWAGSVVSEADLPGALAALRSEMATAQVAGDQGVAGAERATWAYVDVVDLVSAIVDADAGAIDAALVSLLDELADPDLERELLTVLLATS